MSEDQTTPDPRTSLQLLWKLSLPGYIADQISKWWIVKNLRLGGDRIEVIPDTFWIDHVANTGVAWGVGNGGKFSNLLFGAIAVTALAGVLLMWRKAQFPTRVGRVAAALLVAGALGNLTDRLIHNYVVDWITTNLPLIGPFPSFNLADSFICIAAGLLIFSTFQKIPETPIPNEH